MSDIDLKNLTIKSAHQHLKSKDFSCKELTGAYLKNIEKKNETLNAYLEVFDDLEVKASKIGENFASFSDNFLAGIPIAMKDNILINGKTASCSSKILSNYKATYDSTVTDRLKKAGALFLGRTNMDEFAMGSSTENSAFGPTKNPVDQSRVPGGSSGGSVAAVASDMALAALGSDTGGSIRQPAALCGVVGLKTTYGSVSRHGLIAMASSLDQIGPITKTVEDSEIIFNAISGHDPMDSTSASPELRRAAVTNKKRTMKLGLPKEFVQKGVDADVLENFNDIVSKLSKNGYEIVEIDMPTIKYSLAVYYVIMPAEVSTNLARFDGVKYGLHVDGDNLLADYLKSRGRGFGPEVRRRIILGTYILSSGYYDAYYKKATDVRRVIGREFAKVFNNQTGVDAVLMPTTTSPAFKIGEKVSDPLSMYLQDIFTVSANVVGIPGISVPSGEVLRDGTKLPIGFSASFSRRYFI